MAAIDPPARQLDPSQTRRLVGRLCLRPGERVLLLGPGSEAVARLTAYLVGPAGQVVEAAYGTVPPAGCSPFADGEFDAVLTGPATTVDPDQIGVLAEVGRVTAPTGRVAFAAVPPGDRDPADVYALVARAGLRGTGVQLEHGTGPDAEPVFLVTAFPPRPANSRPDQDRRAGDR